MIQDPIFYNSSQDGLPITRVVDGGGVYGSEDGIEGGAKVDSLGTNIPLSSVFSSISGNLYSILNSFQGKILTLISMFMVSPFLRNISSLRL